MTDDAIAVSVGEGTEDRLGAMLAASVNDPSPFMAFEMAVGRNYGFMGDAMMMDDDGGIESMPELQQAMQAAAGVCCCWDLRRAIFSQPAKTESLAKPRPKTVMVPPPAVC